MTPYRNRLGFAAIVIASLLVAAAAEAGPNDEPVRRRACSWDGSSGSVRVGWGSPSRTNGCFFFSGPADLGRDDHLGGRAVWTRQGANVSLDFGGGARFAGTIGANGSVVMTRVSTHDFGGAWTVTETIRGTLSVRDGCASFRGQYHYDECDGPSCPGTCHIDATLQLSGG